MQTAEKDFKAKNFDAALSGYGKALSAQANNYLALSHSGDALIALGRTKEALDFFDRAIAANPYAYETYIRKAMALVELKEWEQAKASYVAVLAMVPRNRFVLDELAGHSEQMKVKVARDLFTPKAQITIKNDSPRIVMGTSDLEAEIWMLYGTCKAIWLVEPSITAKKKHNPQSWSSHEDHECLSATLTYYEMVKSKENLKPIMDFERLKLIIKAGFFEEFLYYQFGSQVLPQITLFHSPEQMERMRKFIEMFVLMKKRDLRKQTPF